MSEWKEAHGHRLQMPKPYRIVDKKNDDEMKAYDAAEIEPYIEQLQAQIQAAEKEIDEQNKTANHYREETLRLRAQVQVADELHSAISSYFEWLNNPEAPITLGGAKERESRVLKAMKAYQLKRMDNSEFDEWCGQYEEKQNAEP